MRLFAKGFCCGLGIAGVVFMAWLCYEPEDWDQDE